MHVMLDLETLGVRSSAVIAAIGAVEFDPQSDRLGEQFYVTVNIQSCIDYGLTMDVSTILWWMDQSEDARKSTFVQECTLPNALDTFHRYLLGAAAAADLVGTHVKIWGNGSDFDNVILANAYLSIKERAPWRFSNNRCFRTLKNLGPNPKNVPMRTGVHHNALDDALFQARYAQKLIQHFGVTPQ